MLGDEDLDPHLLLWDVHRNIDLAAVPGGRTVLYFRLPNVPGAAGHWWIVIGQDGADLCDSDPGHGVTLSIITSLRTLTCLWRGDITWADAAREGLTLVNDRANGLPVVKIAASEAKRRLAERTFTSDSQIIVNGHHIKQQSDCKCVMPAFPLIRCC